jgi:hypothetical protein
MFTNNHNERFCPVNTRSQVFRYCAISNLLTGSNKTAICILLGRTISYLASSLLKAILQIAQSLYISTVVAYENIMYIGHYDFV